MKKMLCVLACAAVTTAFAAATPPDDEEDAKAPPRAESQQNKMKTCNVEAHKKELKGDERRAFMSECLKKH